MSQSLPTPIDVVYQNGLLKPEKPLDLPDGTKLQVTIVPPISEALDATDKQIVREILDEDREVFEALRQAASDTAEDVFERELAGRGLITLPKQPTSPLPLRRFVTIRGKPLSETIIEERR